ncbi:TetR/AcrR family transcriptional regulator [Variovorax sp. RT4R15]|uniref:TetR/AcrR family transcriptional regulator n=1 Tax=Variovorax sp. RT4R15 TaxID=3443737 RepID=UPI003F474E30
MKVLTEARRMAIVEAAGKLFQEFGFEGASMNELAARLQGSKATLYRYFPSKEALFDAVVRASATSHLSMAVEGLQADVDAKETIRSALVRFGERMLFVLTDDARALDIYRMVVAEAGRSRVGELFYEAGPRESVKALAVILKRAMERRELRRTNPHVMALHFLGLVTAEIDRRLYQQKPPALSTRQIRAMVERAVDMFLGGAVPR